MFSIFNCHTDFSTEVHGVRQILSTHLFSKRRICFPVALRPLRLWLWVKLGYPSDG
jgi:hypothetical protein